MPKDTYNKCEILLDYVCQQYNDFMQEEMLRLSSVPTSPLPDPTTPMTTFTGHTKGRTASESQVALNNFKKGCISLSHLQE